MIPKVQTEENKLGEIEFRRKLALQFVGRGNFFPGAPSDLEFNNIITNRVNNYKNYFRNLNRKRILKSPYLEIGGGVGQAAMLLENKYNLRGFSLDISLETLLLGKKYLKLLRYKKMPVRICADAYKLPFKKGSIPFIFCFETLHHFPDPKPILKEIERVLAPGGYFYFNEEPIGQEFNLNLWHRDYHLRWFEKVLKSIFVLHFLSRIGRSEVEHNILEEAFSLSKWENALNIFEKVEANVGNFPFKPFIKRINNKALGWLTPNMFFFLLIKLLGGGIEALAQKAGNINQKLNPIKTYLVCPNCQSSFQETQRELYCPKCKLNFLIRNGVYVMLPKKLQELHNR